MKDQGPTRKEPAVVWVTNFLAPYRIPLFQALASHGVALDVIVAAIHDERRPWSLDEKEKWNFRIHDLAHPARRSSVTSIEFFSGRGVKKLLNRLDPDLVVVGGYTSGHYRTAAKWARRRGRPAVLFAESHEASAGRLGRILHGLKASMLARHDFFIATGTAVREFLTLRVGIDPQRIFQTVNAVDTSRFSKPQINKRPDVPRFLFVGRLTQDKGVLELLRAWLEVTKKLPDAELTILGDGPLQARLLEATRQDLHLHWFRTLPEGRMPSFYAEHDVLILPSRREVWGLVVNEALASGLYCLVSRAAGCQPDLVPPGQRVGDVVEPRNSHSVAAAMLRAGAAWKLGFDRKGIQEWGRSFSVETAAKQISSALASIASRGDTTRRRRIGTRWLCRGIFLAYFSQSLAHDSRMYPGTGAYNGAISARGKEFTAAMSGLEALHEWKGATK